MLDRQTFLRPIAHRGLHDWARGRIENTAPAFEAAIAKGYGIECDLRPISGGLPVVFHDETLDRLVNGRGSLAGLTIPDLKHLSYQGQQERILTFEALLDLVSGKVPLVVEVKSEWEPPDATFLRQVASLALAYRGAIALMSFDPAVMEALRELAPAIPRGIVSGHYQGDGWWPDRIGANRAYRLSNLLESRAASPDFFAFHVKALPTPVTQFLREVLGMPLLTWTVRTEDDRRVAALHADAPIFEGFDASGP